MIARTLLLLFATGTILFTSCKKEHTCQCCGGFTGGCWDESVIKNRSRSDAKDICQAKGGGGSDFNCDLK
jgi:hypothetical protein